MGLLEGKPVKRNRWLNEESGHSNRVAQLFLSSFVKRLDELIGKGNYPSMSEAIREL